MLGAGRWLALAGATALASACATVPDRSPVTGQPLASGGEWSAEVPANWNGTLLLHSRGYAGAKGTPEAAPPRYREQLLGAGYAIAGSNYGSGGWALAEAVPAQEATVAAFRQRYGKPQRVIGYGFSMGGLVTTALAERPDPKIDGAISLCSSMGGSLAMMNMGLDGAFAFRTLVAPAAGIQLVEIADDRANAARVAQAVKQAAATPEGRARIALATTLAGIPAWVPSVPGETIAQKDVRELAALTTSMPMGVFLPRGEQEQRAGGNASWNAGIKYAAQLEASARRAFVERIYALAGLDLDADLAKLAATPRIAANRQAADYMAANYIPTGEPRVPLLALQALGDTITSPSLQDGYAAKAAPAMMQSLFVPQAGHCDFTGEQMMDAVHRIEARLDRGSWQVPSALHATERPAPMLRSCFAGGPCAGRPDQ